MNKMKQKLLVVAMIMILVLSNSMSVFAAPGKRDLYYKGLRDNLNSIPLTPTSYAAYYPDLDVLLDQIFAAIITPEMDTQDKLQACYDYIINNTSYGYTSCWTMDPFVVAGVVLTEHYGVCDDYTATLCVMAWKLGIPMYAMAGQTHTTDGGFTGHAWCQLDINGVSYIFDPQVEDAIAGRQNGRISYIRFGGTTTQLADKYQNGEMSYYYDFSVN